MNNLKDRAAADYTDLIVRQGLKQSGPQRYAGTLSPDLIPHVEVANPAAAFGTDASYATDPGVDLAQAATVYVRTRTWGEVAKAVDAKLYLGVAPPTVMLWPDQLAMRETLDGGKYAVVSVPAGAIGVSPSPFATTAADADGTLGGYAWTVAHPVTLKRLGSVPELADFLYQTPAFAQRGSLFIPDAKDEYRYDCTYEHRGATAVDMLFRIEWDDCPTGWMVGLDGEYGIGLPMTAASGSMGIANQVSLAGDFTAKLTWRLQGPGPGPTTQFRLMVYLVKHQGGNDFWYPVGGSSLRARP